MSAEEIPQSQVYTQNSRVAVVAIGGAGNNLLEKAIGNGVSPSKCVAVNTDRIQLSESPAGSKVMMGSFSSTPNSRDDGRHQTSIDVTAHRVTPLVEGSTCAIVLAGLGGVLGTSAGPLIAHLTRTPERLVVSIVALPFLHERERRFVALRGLKQMAKASNCTVVVDNAVNQEFSRLSSRSSDECAGLAVRSLSEFVSHANPETSNAALDVMSLGPIATVCTTRITAGEGIQKTVMEALRRPSADLPFDQAKGAVLLLNNSKEVNNGAAALAYETLTSLIGHDVKFVYGGTREMSDPTVCIFLTGYGYDSTIRSLVDFVELYDVEYGQPSVARPFYIEAPLFQMERP